MNVHVAAWHIYYATTELVAPAAESAVTCQTLRFKLSGNIRPSTNADFFSDSSPFGHHNAP